jgi:hypothetical protein
MEITNKKYNEKTHTVTHQGWTELNMSNYLYGSIWCESQN